MTARKLAVYEALNHARKEIFVGVTERPLADVIERSWDRPLEISHWTPAEDLSIRGLSEMMPEADASEFVEVYVSYIEREGWKIICQRLNG